MKIEFSLQDKLTSCGAVGKGVMLNGQAIAFVMPHVIAEECEDFTVLHLSDRVVLEHTLTGKRYKVCCSQSNTFNINPSYTKGIGRSDFGVNCKREIEEYANGVAFCFTQDLNNIVILFKDLKNIELSDKGIVKFGGEY